MPEYDDTCSVSSRIHQATRTRDELAKARALNGWLSAIVLAAALVAWTIYAMAKAGMIR